MNFIIEIIGDKNVLDTLDELALLIEESKQKTKKLNAKREIRELQMIGDGIIVNMKISGAVKQGSFKF